MIKDIIPIKLLYAFCELVVLWVLFFPFYWVIMWFCQNLSFSFDAVFETCLRLIVVRFIYFCFLFFWVESRKYFLSKLTVSLLLWFFFILLVCLVSVLFFFIKKKKFIIFLHLMLKCNCIWSQFPMMNLALAPIQIMQMVLVFVIFFQFEHFKFKNFWDKSPSVRLIWNKFFSCWECWIRSVWTQHKNYSFNPPIDHSI